MKDKQTGEPNGMLLDRAQGLVGARGSARGPGDAEQAILLGVKRSIELGWCEIQDAGGSIAEVACSRENFTAKARSSCGSTRRFEVRVRTRASY